MSSPSLPDNGDALNSPSSQSETERTELTRRHFLKTAGAGAIASGVAASGVVGVTGLPSALAQPAPSPAPDPVTAARQPYAPPAPVKLPAIDAPTERQSPPPPTILPPSQRVGFAVVGLGHLTIEELLPAFGECKMSRLVALVSGDKPKAQRLAAQHGVDPKNVYDYQTYDRLRDNPAVEVIYIVLPNEMHEEFTIRGAQAGKHILCEKPMANNPAQARNMIRACREANRKLMIAYRIQYEAYNREARKIIRSGALGKPKIMETVNGQNQANTPQWRHDKKLAGGGSLPDVGLYCLNTTRFLLGEEPTEVFGTTYSTPGDPRFREIEENCLWQMRFPSGVQANCATGYGHHESRRYRMNLERGWVELNPAYSYSGLHMDIGRAEGQSDRVEDRRLTPRNQFATEMDHMSDCVIHNKTPFTPGEEGLQDQIIMEAIYQSSREGKVIKLPPVAARDAFRGPEPVGL